MVYIDLTTTSHTTAKTGIQKVCRRLFTELSGLSETVPICQDPFTGAWRKLSHPETRTLNDPTAGKSRAEKWSLLGHSIGWLSIFQKRDFPPLAPARCFICPEIFSQKRADCFGSLFPTIRGPRVALFHDAIALKLPEMTPTSVLSRFPSYLKELATFDGVAAISEDSAACLSDYWKWLGIQPSTQIKAITLGIDLPKAVETRTDGDRAETSSPLILSVGTIEGRKNHLSLLEAAERLWKQGVSFELELVGLSHPTTGKKALSRIRELQRSGYPLRYCGPLDESALQSRYQVALFTVYPSLMEGFGLPVLESLSYGKPCICSDQGALGESARGGGCFLLGSVTPDSLFNAIEKLLKCRQLLQELTEQAQRRSFKTWRQYAKDLLGWIDDLSN